MRGPVRRLLVLALLLVLAACGGGADEQTLTVLAAASLTESFTELAQDFEDEHPGVDVKLVFGSSTTLAEQLADGAPGDVLATADERAMDVAVEAGAVGDPPEAFATNTLVLVTPPDNPAEVVGVRSLDRADVDWVACVETAPCGALARTVLSSNGIRRLPVSEEVDVKAVLARVTAGEADAGLVYRTDALAAGDDVTTVDAGEGNPATLYDIATASDTAAARQFVELVMGERGQSVLREAGFGEARTFGDAG